MLPLIHASCITEDVQLQSKLKEATKLEPACSGLDVRRKLRKEEWGKRKKEQSEFVVLGFRHTAAPWNEDSRVRTAMPVVQKSVRV